MLLKSGNRIPPLVSPFLVDIICRRMGSTWAFKITASLIKPTRETLLDYCSYLLLIVSVIGIARVIIGSDNLKHDCFADTSLEQTDENAISASNMSTSQASSDNRTTNDVATHNALCSKYYQSYFPYVLVVESLVLLCIGILWVKIPKVQSVVNEFSGLLHESRKASWFKNIARTNQSSSVFVTDIVEVHLLLDTLFQRTTQYCDKSQARLLYEKIQKFCYDQEHSLGLWRLYIRKSAIQFFCWLIVIVINMMLFVKLEFYVGCETTNQFCSHDTFLRIVWFLSQMLFLIYGMFNIATLKWVAQKSNSNKTCSFCKLFCGSSNEVHQMLVGDGPQFCCKPFSVYEGGRLIHNDMALLLHLVSSSNKKFLPYFTVFLFDEWREKLLVPIGANDVITEDVFGFPVPSSSGRLIDTSDMDDSF